MKLAVVMPCYGQWKLAAGALRSLCKQVPYDAVLTTYVIDNGSPESPTPYRIANWCNTLITLPKNVGVTKSWNIGIQRALNDGADVVCVSNSDVVFGRTVLRECLACLRAGNHSCYPYSIKGGPLSPDWEKIDASYGPIQSMWSDGGYAGGWCFFLTRECLEKVGLFDERFTLWYQDAQYWRRLRMANKPLQVVQSCILHHYESRTIVSMPGQFDCYGWRENDAKEFAKWLKEVGLPE